MELIRSSTHKEEWQADKIRSRLTANRPYKCADCGKNIWKLSDYNNRLELHHIIPLSRGGITSNNLTKLCGKCHQQRHNKLKGTPELPLLWTV